MIASPMPLSAPVTTKRTSRPAFSTGKVSVMRQLSIEGTQLPTTHRSASSSEVPVAIIEKAKTCGGHNLSGAVMRPQALQDLFPDMTREQWRTRQGRS